MGPPVPPGAQRAVPFKIFRGNWGAALLPSGGASDIIIALEKNIKMEKGARNVGNEEYVLPGALNVSAEAVDKLLAAADGDAALLYLYLLRNGRLNLAAAARTLCLGERAAPAAERLRRLGLIRGRTEAAAAPVQTKAPDPEPKEPPRSLPAPADKLPDYTSGDARRLQRQNPEFAALIREVEQLLNNILSANALVDFMGFYDYLGLPTNVILMLVVYCVEESERRYGKDRRPSMRTIRAEAYKWAENGVFTLEAAEEYIRRAEHSRERSAGIRSLLGIVGRAPSTTEERYIAEWAAAGYSDELLRAAYDKTTQNTGRMVWKYMDSILKSWAEKGLRTLEEVHTGDTRLTEEPGGQQETDSGSEELARMRKYLNKLKQS